MSTIAVLAADENGANSRTDINSNFENLNTDKIEAESTDVLKNKTIDSAFNTILIDGVPITAPTGTGQPVLDDSPIITTPTLITPVIADFTDAQHDHSDADDGGQLNASTAFGSGTMPTARLGSGAASSGTFLRGDQTWSSSGIAAVPNLIDMRVYNTTAKSYNSDADFVVIGGTSGELTIEQAEYPMQKRVFTTDWATAFESNSFVLQGDFVYALYRDGSDAYRVYRYDRTNLATGGTLMTIAGQAFSTSGGSDLIMSSNGTDFFFNFKGGNSANDYVISQYTLSGTTLTYSADITCGSTAQSFDFFQVDSSTNLFGLSSADGNVRKHNSSGTLQYTVGGFTAGAAFVRINDFYYIYENTVDGDSPRLVKVVLV